MNGGRSFSICLQSVIEGLIALENLSVSRHARVWYLLVVRSIESTSDTWAHRHIK